MEERTTIKLSFSDLLQVALAFTPPLMKLERRFMDDILKFIENVIIILVMSIVLICSIVVDLISNNIVFILIGGVLFITYRYFKSIQ